MSSENSIPPSSNDKPKTPSQPDLNRVLSNEEVLKMHPTDYEEDSILQGIREGAADRKKLEDQTRLPMQATELNPWARNLLRHLEEFRPKEYADLQQSGTLYEHVQGIADHAGLEMSDLLQSGLPYNQAFEVIKPQLYPPPRTRHG